MKRIIYILMAVVLLSSCSTSKKAATVGKSAPAATVSKPAPVAPAGVTFTKVENFRAFASIQRPYEGSGFGKQDSGGAKNDAGKPVPTIIFKGFHVYTYEDITSGGYPVKGDKSDLNAILEGLKESVYLKGLLEKENVIEEYSDLMLGGRACKRVSVSYLLSREDYAAVSYLIGYLIQNNGTPAFFFIDRPKSDPTHFEADSKLVDSVLKYMVETVEFREYNK